VHQTGIATSAPSAGVLEKKALPPMVHRPREVPDSIALVFHHTVQDKWSFTFFCSANGLLTWQLRLGDRAVIGSGRNPLAERLNARRGDGGYNLAIHSVRLHRHE
jgi:hypothetical protein